MAPRMRGRTVAALYVAAMIVVIVAVDVLLFKGRPWPRLAANVAIVLIFAIVYFRFLQNV